MPENIILQAADRWAQIGSARDASTNTIITANDDDDDDTAAATTANATATPAVTTYSGVLQALLFVSPIHKFRLFNGLRIVLISKQPTGDPCSQPNEIRFQPSDMIFPR